MRLLPDTHVLLWALDNPAGLGRRARSLIERSSVLVSVASLWEIGIKAGLDKLKIGPQDVIRRHRALGLRRAAGAGGACDRSVFPGCRTRRPLRSPAGRAGNVRAHHPAYFRRSTTRLRVFGSTGGVIVPALQRSTGRKQPFAPGRSGSDADTDTPDSAGSSCHATRACLFGGEFTP